MVLQLSPPWSAPWLLALACVAALRILGSANPPVRCEHCGAVWRNRKKASNCPKCLASASVEYHFSPLDWIWAAVIIGTGIVALLLFSSELFLSARSIEIFDHDDIGFRHLLAVQYACVCLLTIVPYSLLTRWERLSLLLNAALVDFSVSIVALIVANSIVPVPGPRLWPMSEKTIAFVTYALLANLLACASVAVHAHVLKRRIYRLQDSSHPRTVLRAESPKPAESIQPPFVRTPTDAAAVSPHSVGPPLATCANCDSPIGRLEPSFTWKDHLVCALCHQRLQAIHD
jgi:hypothetical protein